MSEDLISVIDVASDLGQRKQQIFKVMKRLGIERKLQRSSARHGQSIAYITRDDFLRVKQELQPVINFNNLDKSIPNLSLGEEGVFYLLLLEPDHDPGRFKVGFAQSLDERVRTLRCSAPFLKVIKTWDCKRLWEKTAIECVSDGCEQLHTEVFRTASIESVIAKCEKFFELMPKVQRKHGH